MAGLKDHIGGGFGVYGKFKIKGLSIRMAGSYRMGFLFNGNVW
jgi:hypothetical protein